MSEDMAVKAGPSTSMEYGSANESVCESPPFNDDFKHDFTQALDVMKSMFRENSMLVSVPRTNISRAARAMAHVFYDAVLNASNECEIVNDEDLILPDDPEVTNEYEECSRKKLKSNDYDPNELEEYEQKQFVPLEYKLKAVAFADAHPNASLKTMQSRGFAKLKHKTTLARWRQEIQKG
ncbi:hypothetical protein ABEB36_014521 [Hypothenemus hampei]|uniref:Uncharacterized protein n=1 Tax=Hypothenemus hampei TaxID=57062 RepID=A0ABD1E224_HYPHA